MEKSLLQHLFIIFTLCGVTHTYAMTIGAKRIIKTPPSHKIPSAIQYPQLRGPIREHPTSQWTDRFKKILWGPNKTHLQVLDETRHFLTKIEKNEPGASDPLRMFLEKNNQEEVNILLNELIFTTNGLDELIDFIDVLQWGITIGNKDNFIIIKKIMTWTKDATGKFGIIPLDKQVKLLNLLNENEQGTIPIVKNIFRIISDELIHQLKNIFTKKETAPPSQE